MFIVVNVKAARGYTMRARAESTARTRARILDAVIALSEERLALEIVLADVAERAGVSVQTVLRHFGSKECRGLTWPGSWLSPGTEAATSRRCSGIAAELRARGHDVRVLGHPQQRDTVELTPDGLRFWRF